VPLQSPGPPLYVDKCGQVLVTKVKNLHKGASNLEIIMW